MMGKLALVLMAVALPAMAQLQPQRIMCSGPNDPTCPQQCRKDLSQHYVYIVRDRLPLGTEGIYIGPTVGPKLNGVSIIKRVQITIADDLPVRYLAAVQHHEACHHEMALTTGSHVFHP